MKEHKEGEDIVIERRYAILQVSPEYLVTLCKFHGEVNCLENGLPEDARMVSVGVYQTKTFQFDIVSGMVGIIIESASFEDVPPGVPLPVLSPPKLSFRRKNISTEEIDAKCPACGAFKLEGFFKSIRCTACQWEKLK